MSNLTPEEYERVRALISGTHRPSINRRFYATWASIVEQFNATGSLSHAQIDVLIKTNEIASITYAKSRAARNYDFNATANRVFNPTKPRK